MTRNSAPSNGLSKTRGYLLMEVMVASAILAIAIGTVVGHLGRARMDQARGSYRDVAAGLAHAIASNVESTPGARTPSTWSALTSPGPQYPGFLGRWRVQEATGTQTATINHLGAAVPTGTLFTIQAEVTYPVRVASADDMGDGLADGRAIVVSERIVR